LVDWRRKRRQTYKRNNISAFEFRSYSTKIYYDFGKKGKGSPYSIAKRSVSELIPVLGSQPSGEVSHKPGDRLPLLPARPAVTLATLKRATTRFDAWRTEAWRV